MLEWIGYISLGAAALFIVLLGCAFLINLKKKSLKVRKQIIARRRLHGILAGLFLIVGIALLMLSGGNGSWQLFKDDSSPIDGYKEMLAATDEKTAVDALPDRIFALGDDYYIRTGEGKVYGYAVAAEQASEDHAEKKEEKQEEKKEQGYQEGLCFTDVAQVSGAGNLLAVLDQKGALRVNGAFEYLTYEKDDTVFEQELYAENCSYVDATANDLFYVDGGTLYSVGYNKFGKLGDGTERNRLERAQILENVASVSSSETHTLAVDIYGNLYGFGDNGYSEMGNRTTASSSIPEKLMGGVKQAEAGRYFSVVLTKNGDVYVAGRNDKGQLGTGDDRSYATYRKILGGVMKISVCGNSCAALTDQGVLYVWGSNVDKQLGAGKDKLLKPSEFAKDVYDMAVGEKSIGIIKLNRDVAVTGVARPEQNKEHQQYLYQFDATVPEDRLYQQTVELPTKSEKNEKK